MPYSKKYDVQYTELQNKTHSLLQATQSLHIHFPLETRVGGGGRQFKSSYCNLTHESNHHINKLKFIYIFFPPFNPPTLPLNIKLLFHLQPKQQQSRCPTSFRVRINGDAMIKFTNKFTNELDCSIRLVTFEKESSYAEGELK